MKIDKNIQLPESDEKSKYIFKDMEVGDSAAFTLDKMQYAYQVAMKTGERKGMKFTRRTVIENGEKIVRIWRVK